MPAGRMMLSAPVRLYWELTPEQLGGVSEKVALRLADELVSMKVFFVTLRLTGGVRDGLASVMDRLGSGGIKAKLSVGHVSLMPDTDTVSLGDGIDLYLDRPDGGLVELLRELHEACDKSSLCKVASVSAVPSKHNAVAFTGLFEECLRIGVTAISLPNPTVVGTNGGAKEYVLDKAARKAIKSAAESILKPRPDSVKLFVHDLFLYRELDMPGLSERTEYAGCQAAEALAYIAADGTVYPCASWPEPLGSLRESTFSKIWAGKKRKEVAERIGRLPELCKKCDDREVCLAGCRGLAFAVEHKDGPDPACPVMDNQE